MVLICIIKLLLVFCEMVCGVIIVGEVVGVVDGVVIMGCGVGVGLLFFSILGVKVVGVLRKLLLVIGVLVGFLFFSVELLIGRMLFCGLDIEFVFVLLFKLGGVGRV